MALLARKTRNPKLEIRRKHETANPKERPARNSQRLVTSCGQIGNHLPLLLAVWFFELVSDFELRVSDLPLGHFERVVGVAHGQDRAGALADDLADLPPKMRATVISGMSASMTVNDVNDKGAGVRPRYSGFQQQKVQHFWLVLRHRYW